MDTFNFIIHVKIIIIYTSIFLIPWVNFLDIKDDNRYKSLGKILSDNSFLIIYTLLIYLFYSANFEPSISDFDSNILNYIFKYPLASFIYSITITLLFWIVIILIFSNKYSLKEIRKRKKEKKEKFQNELTKLHNVIKEKNNIYKNFLESNKHLNKDDKYSNLVDTYYFKESIRNDIYILEEIEYIYITNATNRDRNDKYSIRKLFYHTNKDCDLMHNDLKDKEGNIIAYNSGIILVENDFSLTLCSKCSVSISNEISKYKKITYTPSPSPPTKKIISFTKECPKCDGSGYISYYNHIQNGICFRCNGKGRVLN